MEGSCDGAADGFIDGTELEEGSCDGTSSLSKVQLSGSGRSTGGLKS